MDRYAAAYRCDTWARARQVAAGRAAGRRRARRRVDADAGPHPAWRRFIAPGWTVLGDQRAAWARVRELADRELWRADARENYLAVLWVLVCAMEHGGPERPGGWSRRGLVTRVTRERVAERVGCSVRTVSRATAWAREAEVLVVVEAGASAAFLESDTNRAPSYVFVAPEGWTPPPPHRSADRTAQTEADEVVEASGNLPASCVDTGALGETRGRDDPQPTDSHRHTAGSRCRKQRLEAPRWPGWDRADTAAARAAATSTLLDRIGLAGRVPRHRAHGLLSAWWSAGWGVEALVWAIGHHPDRPGPEHERGGDRGDVARGARDSLRALGARLAPWRGRRSELPARLQAVDGAERRRRAAERAARDTTPDPHPSGIPDSLGRAGWEPTSRPEARAAALAALADARQSRGVRPAHGTVRVG